MPTISSIASAMFGFEGTNPNLIANNNPGNLVYVGQAGASPGTNGFAAFSSLADGIAAAENQISLDLTRGSCASGQPVVSLADLIACWSPPSASGNSQASYNNYVSTVANQTGLDASQSLLAQLTGEGDTSVGSGAGDSSTGFSTGDLLDPSQPYLWIGLAAGFLWLWYEHK